MLLDKFRPIKGQSEEDALVITITIEPTLLLFWGFYFCFLLIVGGHHSFLCAH